jgi:hypothetical protein
MVGVTGAFALMLIVNLVHGAHGGLVSMIGLDRSWTWLVTLALLAASFVAIGILIKERWDGIFIGAQNKISLSRFQLVGWTLVIGAGLLTAGLANVSLGDATPLNIKIPPDVWALLGLGSFTFVASPAILTQKERSGATNARLGNINAALKPTDKLKADLTAVGPVVQKAAPEDARWRDLFRGDESDADLVDFSKVQQLLLTTLLVVTYAAALFTMFGSAGVQKTFPDVSTGFLALLGISHAAYLGYKLAPKSGS